MPHLSRKHFCIPYAIFLAAFVLLPLLVVLYYAFTNEQGQFTLSNFLHFFTESNMLGTLLYSLIIGALVTFCCLLLGYPVAYILAREPFRNASSMLLVFVLPMWINFTLRITALKEILTALEGSLAYHPFANTIIGMTYDFLPFTILPLYTCLQKIDNSLCEAARDLGAGSVMVFFKVILPLSIPGIISAVMMVFLPSMTNYVVLDLFYNSTYIIGSLIGSYFSAYDWHNGSIISIILLLIIVIITLFTRRYEKSPEESRRAVL